MSKRRRGKIAAGVLVLTAAAGGVFYLNYADTEKSNEAASAAVKTETVQYGSVTSGITESGSVAFGELEQTFSIASVTEVSSSASESSTSGSSSAAGNSGSMMNPGGMQGMTGAASVQSGNTGSSSSDSSTAALEVEEIYVNSGQVVAAGDPMLKISEDSIAEYRSEMEASVETAKLNVKQEEINVESKRAEADYTYEMYLAKGKTAQETYDATITSLENEITDLQEDLEEAQEEVDELEDELASGYDVEDDLEEAQLNYSTIEANLKIAENNLVTGTIEAKQTYENAMTNYQYADQLYEIDTNGLEDDLDDAKEVLEEAEAALAEFEEQIGDGVVYAEYAGTVRSVGCSAGDTLSDDMTIATFADTENITMTVSVSQEDISNITVGDEVSIGLTAYRNETFPGEVDSIATSATTGSSTVNYEVTVRFTGDVTKVYADMTGEVTFVIKEEKDTLYISNKAVYQDGTRSYVKVLNDDGSITETTIETGYSNGKKAAVLSGLTEGQTVVIESQVTQ